MIQLKRLSRPLCVFICGVYFGKTLTSQVEGRREGDQGGPGGRACWGLWSGWRRTRWERWEAPPPRSHGAQWISVYRTPGSRIEITLFIRFLKRNSDCHPIYDTLSTSCITDQGLGRLYLEGNRRAGQTRRRSVEYGTQSGDDAEMSGGHEGPRRCGSRDGR